MRQMDKVAIRAALPWDRLIEALAAMFREGCEAPLRHRHAWADGAGAQNTLLLMPAWRAGGHYGVKIVHVAPGNDRRSLPAVHASYLLSDAATGAPLAMLDGGELTDRRTAAASLLAGLRDIMFKEHRNIFGSLRQGRQPDPHDIQPIEQIRVKLPRRQLFRQIKVAARNHPHCGASLQRFHHGKLCFRPKMSHLVKKQQSPPRRIQRRHHRSRPRHHVEHWADMLHRLAPSGRGAGL